MPTNQRLDPVCMGFVSTSGTTEKSFLTDCLATANWLAFNFVPDTTKTVNAVKAFVSAVAGTLAAAALSCDIYSDASGVPNASLGTTTTLTGGEPTGAGWVEFTGLSVACTAGTQYWIVFKNNDAAPTVNKPTFRYVGSGAFQTGLTPSPFQVSGSGYGAGLVYTTTNSGGAWSNTAIGGGTFRVQYSDGSYFGMPFSAVVSATAANGAFGKQELGVKLTTPLNAVLNVRGVAMCPFKVAGTPGNLSYRLYNGVTLLATTTAIPVANTPTGFRMAPAYFAATQAVQPGTVLRVVASDATAADTSSNAYSMPEYTVENDANSQALMPFQGTLQKTLTTDNTANPVVFADTATAVYPVLLILDTDGEFLPAAFGQTTGSRSIGTY